MAPSTTACARCRAVSRSPSTSTATVRAPRSRARRTPAAAARRSASDVVSARGPSPATTMQRPSACACVTCPDFPWNFSASSTRLSCPCAARSRRARRSGSFVSPTYRPTTSASAATSSSRFVLISTFTRSVPLLAPRPSQRLGPPDHVQEPLGRVELGHPLDLDPLRIASVAPGQDVQGVRIRQVVHQYVMISDAARVVLHDAIEHPRHVDDPDLDPALFHDLARDGLARGLAELDETPGQAPLPERGRLAAPHEQHLVFVQDDGADADPGIVRILAAHAGPASQTSVAYFSRTRRSTTAISSAARPSGRRSIACSASKAAASAVTTSSNFGRWPSAASSVVIVASGSRVVGKRRARRSASTPRRTDPCWRNVLP